MDETPSKASTASLQTGTRKRACISKVRTGCTTCKERRVKCDEAKPTCLRCARARQSCKGYSLLPSKPRPPKPDPVIRRLLPRQITNQSHGLAITVGRSLPSIRLDGSDVLYFDFFRSEAARELSGYLSSTFWSRTVLCETLTDPCIRHAILALGAASYPTVARNQGLLPSSASEATLDMHGRAAICHHIKALSLFREMMANGVGDFPSRSAFIVTPLLVAFAMLQNNNQAAEALLSGLKVLQEVCHIWQGKKLLRNSAGLLVNEEKERLTSLMLQVYSKQNSPIHLKLTVNAAVLCGHNPLYLSQKDNVFTMPSTLFLDSSPPPNWNELTASSMDNLLSTWTSFSSRCLVWLRHTDYTKHSIDPMVYAKACEEQAHVVAYLLQWRQFIYGLQPAPGLDAACWRGLKLVRLQYDTLYIWAAEALDRTRLGFDAHNTEFERVIDLCADLLGEGLDDRRTPGQYSPAPYTGYTFESFGVVAVLGFVITRCRAGNVRRRAMGLLERIWWRENGWDTVACYQGTKALMELEEQGGIRGADGELFIPAESRYYWGNARWENDQPTSQKLICTFAQRRPDELGEVAEVPVTIDLSALTLLVPMTYLAVKVNLDWPYRQRSNRF
ncbi:hypothetical protein diail_9532 [Diaporthe ilicicola]|nr:hypothetical protein diail_9532 [Diaporthe ilicicola]